MAKQAVAKSSTGKSRSRDKGARTGTAIARRNPSRDHRSADAGEMFITLLQSPLVAELVAVAATAALAALAEHGFASSNGKGRGKRASTAVKQAGKAAAAAVGRRLGDELDEIRKAANASNSKGGAKK